jgi:hypothetical protein
VKHLAVAALALGMLVGFARSARAEDVVAYQADGDADARAGDARVQALDEAFGKAVVQALGDLLEADVRKQRKSLLDRELVGHARLWVTKFTVTREAVADDRKQLSVSVRIDRDKLRARLAELDIATRSPGEAPGSAGPGPSPSAAPNPAPAMVIALRISAPSAVRASYGPGAEADIPGLAGLSGALRRANFTPTRAPASGPAVRPEGDLPVDDEAAEALAAEARADFVAVAGVAVGPAVPLRGVDASGVLVTAHVRLLDRKAHKVLGHSTVVSAARGAEPGVLGDTLDRALAAAAADALPPTALPPVQAAPFTGADAPLGQPGIVLVRLARATPWPMVQSELKHLVGARGVASATLRRVSPAGWVIGVATTESIDRIASIVKKPPAADTAVSVKIVGDLVEASVTGAP